MFYNTHVVKCSSITHAGYYSLQFEQLLSAKSSYYYINLMSELYNNINSQINANQNLSIYAR